MITVTEHSDQCGISYVSRANPRETSRHVILSTSTVRPMDFAGQLNVSLANGWGIVRTVADLCMRQPDGKYLLVKDPNKVRALRFAKSNRFLLCFDCPLNFPPNSSSQPVIRLYAIPAHSFSAEDEEGYDHEAEVEDGEDA